MIQGGDPLGTGSGGPGYSVEEPPPGKVEYTRGTVAMAKTATEPPGRSGSQFFVVTAADAGLPPQYAVLGEVSSGEDVVDRIARLGDPASGDGHAPGHRRDSEDHCFPPLNGFIKGFPAARHER